MREFRRVAVLLIASVLSNVACQGSAVPADQGASSSGASQPQNAGASAVGRLEIEVGLVMQAGNVQRVARTEFRLVRQSVAAILLANDPKGLSHSKSEVVSNEDMEVGSYCSAIKSPTFIELLKTRQPGRAEALLASESVIEEQTVQTVVTDFAGKAAFVNIVPGPYWVFGCYTWGVGSNAQGADWNVATRVGPKTTVSLILDNNNAMKQ